MTTNRITLAELANREERDRRPKEAIQERDETVKGVFTEFNLQVVGKRQPIADRGWDTSYLCPTRRRRTSTLRNNG